MYTAVFGVPARSQVGLRPGAGRDLAGVSPELAVVCRSQWPDPVCDLCIIPNPLEWPAVTRLVLNKKKMKVLLSMLLVFS